MFASFLATFVAFAACQALLAVKLADVLSPGSDAGRASTAPTRQVGTVKLA